MALTSGELGAELQWLLEFAGTDLVIEAILHHLSPSVSAGQRRLLFLGEDVGHWVYCEKDDGEWNSYKLMHQKPGTHQFCQSFAQIYMLANIIPSKEFGGTTAFELLKSLKEGPENYGSNVAVVARYWSSVLRELGKSKELEKWLLKELRSINESLREHNKGCRRKTQEYNLIAEQDEDITLDLILNTKLAFVARHATEIAESVR
ncbi:unnamed protein product [Durusdinium trenchii]|uniref:Uncharacterized protein n=1 Tax=Durusdinium trenchii TaxID=1381693 RepID=A0ABP0N8L2_9DINO